MQCYIRKKENENIKVVFQLLILVKEKDPLLSCAGYLNWEEEQD